MNKRLISLILLSGCLWGGHAFAAPQQDHEAIRAAALAFAQEQAKALPGEVHIKVSGIDPRLALAPCDALQAFLPAGAKPIGKTTLGVRCDAPTGWNVFVQAEIKVILDLLVANRPLAQGTVLNAGDFSLQRGELDHPGTLTQPEQAIGKTLRFAIGAGQVLRQDMLRAPLLIRQGQNVTLRARGNGFTVSREGQAMNDAAEGELVRIRTASRQIVTGHALADGSVEVRP